MEGVSEGLSHTPFIVASYIVAVVLLTWCALSPLLRKRIALRQIQKLIKNEERSRDTNT